jgi:hypothetical protein
MLENYNSMTTMEKISPRMKHHLAAHIYYSPNQNRPGDRRRFL